MKQSERTELVAVVLNWNGWQHTIEACKSLGTHVGSDFKIIIVDNASTDGSVARLRSAVPQAELIVNSVNEGFAGGCNVGLRRALEMGCDYVFLINNDAVVTSNAIAELVAASKRLNDAAILGSVVRYMGSREYQFFGSKSTQPLLEPKWFEFPRDKHLLELSLIETDFVMGAALFVPVKILRKIGFFDERFFLTYEDVDLCYRARESGVRCGIVTSSTIYHHGSASLGPEIGPLRTYFLTRNELLFVEKHGRWQHRVRLYYLRVRRLFWRALKGLVGGALSDPSMKAMLLGFRDYGLRHFGDCPDAVRRYAKSYGKPSQS
jgi:GT2 family glycosyltransferase